MDAEELHQLLSQVQVLFRLSEADREVEGFRAAKYRNILGTFAGVDSSGPTQPEALRILHAAKSAFVPPAFQTVDVCCPNLYRGCMLMLTCMVLSRHRNQRCSLHPDRLYPIPPWWAESAIHRLLRTVREAREAQKGRADLLVSHNLTTSGPCDTKMSRYGCGRNHRMCRSHTSRIDKS
jgi:hypothetical protein